MANPTDAPWGVALGATAVAALRSKESRVAVAPRRAFENELGTWIVMIMIMICINKYIYIHTHNGFHKWGILKMDGL